MRFAYLWARAIAEVMACPLAHGGLQERVTARAGEVK